MLDHQWEVNWKSEANTWTSAPNETEFRRSRIDHISFTWMFIWVHVLYQSGAAIHSRMIIISSAAIDNFHINHSWGKDCTWTYLWHFNIASHSQILMHVIQHFSKTKVFIVLIHGWGPNFERVPFTNVRSLSPFITRRRHCVSAPC